MIFTEFVYLAAAVLFILGLKLMSHPRTAVMGNFLGVGGMTLAILAALADGHVVGYWWIVAGLVLGAAAGAYLAVTVQMTAMPQMVALLNGLGGAASVFVAGGELALSNPSSRTIDSLVAVAASGLIGGVTFWGSLVAYAKLEEWQIFKKAWSFPGQQVVNAGLLAAAVLLAGLLIYLGTPSARGEIEVLFPVVVYSLLVMLASALGVLLVVPIGGADMPVVIALLNSYSGLAGAATGFVINNNVLIVSGSLVGASGVILSHIMCKAMNRSLWNVLFGFVEGGGGEGPAADEVYATVRRTDPESIATMLADAQRVVIVPGYGMAVAQAQHAVSELASKLEERGATVEYAIHPVAGRMPGHMNVLLAEADVPYTSLKEMDEINPTFPQVDVAIVIGANDVVNPLARTDPKSPIAGMPILDVDKARNVIVMKRSLSPGFAGIPNPLFAAPNTFMYFADGKQGVLDIVTALREV